MNWNKRVARALNERAVRQGIAQIFVDIMTGHIDQNVGRAKGGGAVKHAPLKEMRGSTWVNSPRDGDVVTATRTVQVPVRRKVKGSNGYEIKYVDRKQYRVSNPSYRNGGQPLRNTGKMERSLSANGSRVPSGLRVTLRGVKYALYQDRGFKTSGPNYIPLSMRGVRRHGTGRNPNAEGLKAGQDYMMAWKGVTVPSRPFLLPTKSEMSLIGRSIMLSLRSILKGN